VRETAAWLSRWRPRLAEATGRPARFAWFLRMDPQVEECYGSAGHVARVHADVIAAAQEAGDEIGLHPHPWRFDEARGAWVHDAADPAWVTRVVDTSFRAYREAFGRDCASVRFGSRWLDGATWSRLEGLGVRHDLTVEPGFSGTIGIPEDEVALGAWPDGRDAPNVPYRTDAARFPRASRGAGGPWEIPLACGRVARGTVAGWIARLRGTVPPRRLANLGSGRWLLGPTTPPSEFVPLLDWALRRARRPIAFAIRTDQVLDAATARSMDENLRAVAEHPLARDVEFATPAEAVRGR
jgi:hypothetical protein